MTADDTTSSVETVPPHGSMPEDYCPVCKSLDVTFPIVSTWIKCRGCEASWNGARRVLCHVIGCVEHIDRMHVDRAGDAVVHVGCAVCSALPHHRTPPDSLPDPAAGGGGLAHPGDA